MKQLLKVFLLSLPCIMHNNIQAFFFKIVKANPRLAIERLRNYNSAVGPKFATPLS